MSSLKKFFALSTCIHCRHAREFFEKNNISINPIYVDKLDGPERDRIIEEQRGYNPELTFPTLVFHDGKVIVGFQRDAIARELGL